MNAHCVLGTLWAGKEAAMLRLTTVGLDGARKTLAEQVEQKLPDQFDWKGPGMSAGDGYHKTWGGGAAGHNWWQQFDHIGILKNLQARWAWLLRSIFSALERLSRKMVSPSSLAYSLQK